MTPNPPTPEDPNLDEEAPIPGLDALEAEFSPRFLAAVRNRIDRRRSSAQLVTLFCEVPQTIALEFTFLFSQLPLLFKQDDTHGNPTKTD
jgi:hypothetical protein